MRGRCIIMTRRHCGACKLKMPKSKCPKCFSFFDFQFYLFFSIPSCPKTGENEQKNGWTKTKKGSRKQTKNGNMPTCFQMARSQLAASHPASQHTRKRYENGTETKNTWFRAPVAHCEAQSGGGRQGRKWKKIETETEKKRMFCFSFSWPFGTPTEMGKMKKVKNQLKP